MSKGLQQEYIPKFVLQVNLNIYLRASTIKSEEMLNQMCFVLPLVKLSITIPAI